MSLVLDWNSEQDVKPIEEPLVTLLQQLLQLAGEAEGIEAGEVTLSFVDDETIQQLNREYRNMDKPTDVLSFSMLESGDGEIDIVYGEEDDEEDIGHDGDEADEEEPIAYVEPLGDIIISVPRAIEQANDYGHSFEREIGFLFVHGFLHLLGYDHGSEEEERRMFAKQEAVLAKAGLHR